MLARRKTSGSGPCNLPVNHRSFAVLEGAEESNIAHTRGVNSLVNKLDYLSGDTAEISLYLLDTSIGWNENSRVSPFIF